MAMGAAAEEEEVAGRQRPQSSAWRTRRTRPLLRRLLGMGGGGGRAMLGAIWSGAWEGNLKYLLRSICRSKMMCCRVERRRQIQRVMRQVIIMGPDR